jgi:mono/diheme cytochrome c family protein
MVAAGGLCFALLLMAQDRPDAPVGDTASEQSVERGRYLVHDVAHCVQCHTPRDSRGKLRRDRPLRGAVIPLESPFPGGEWAKESAWIAGLQNYDRETVVFLLRNGRRPDGYVPAAPMPSYRMRKSDAEAVAAYLASLSTPQG